LLFVDTAAVAGWNDADAAAEPACL